MSPDTSTILRPIGRPILSPFRGGPFSAGAGSGSVVKPVISGPLTPGSTIAVTDGVVPGYTKSSNQWLVSYDGGLSFAAIGGATASDYQIPAGDWKAIYKVTETWSNGSNAYDNDSDPTAPVGGDDESPVWDFGSDAPDAAVYDGSGDSDSDIYDGSAAA